MSALDAVRDPDHTGDRRCWPCTVVNLLVVAAVAALVGRRSRARGLAVAGVGVALIALRGYVVPYTPTFAPKLVAASPLPDEWFRTDPDYAEPPVDAVGAERGSKDEVTPDTDAEPNPDHSDDTGLGADTDPDGEELLEVLVEVGAVELDGEDVRLVPDFEESWREEMAVLADADTETLVDEVLTVAYAQGGFAFTNDIENDEWVVLTDGSGTFEGRRWLSRPVAIAEAAAVRALESRLADEGARRAAAGPLRMFLQTCPDCGTELQEESAASCCGGYTGSSEIPPDVLACPECRQRLYTFDD